MVGRQRGDVVAISTRSPAGVEAMLARILTIEVAGPLGVAGLAVGADVQRTGHPVRRGLATVAADAGAGLVRVGNSRGVHAVVGVHDVLIDSPIMGSSTMTDAAVGVDVGQVAVDQVCTR